MKKIKYLIITLISFVLFSGVVDAASTSIKSNSYSITKGGSVTVTATVSSDSPIVSIEGTLMCKGAGANSGVNMEFDDVSNSLYSKSYSTTVKGTSTGTITCSVTGARLTNMASDSWNNISDKSINITVKEPEYIPPKTYSSNNNLTNLQIDGYSISPEFSSSVKEYSVEVPNGTEKVVINATKEVTINPKHILLSNYLENENNAINAFNNTFGNNYQCTDTEKRALCAQAKNNKWKTLFLGYESIVDTITIYGDNDNGTE